MTWNLELGTLAMVVGPLHCMHSILNKRNTFLLVNLLILSN